MSTTNTSFIPYKNHSILPNYAVTSSFTEYPGLDTIGDKYKNYLNGLVSGKVIPNQHAIGKAMGNLQDIINKERTAELAFLNELGGLLQTNLSDDKNTWKALIESFNQILSTTQILERNVSQLKALESTGKGNSSDVTKWLQDTYLPEAIKEFLPIKSIEEINDKLVWKIMQRAIKKMFNATDEIGEEKKEVQCYKEIWEALQGLTYRNALFKNLSDFFNLKDYLQKNFTEIQKDKKLPKITAKQVNSAGEVLERIEEVVLNRFSKMGKISLPSKNISLEIEFKATGKTLQKADTFGIVMAEGKVNTSEMTRGPLKKDDSYRLRSLERIEHILEQIGKKKAQLIFISDKNYLIGKNTFHSKHGGFKAEAPSLSALSNYGAQFHIPNITNMIKYLASAGPEMIVEDVDMCLEVIKASIGQFLFDDLQIEGPVDSGANRVHLLNLGGTYLPASVYLEATLQGLRGIGDLSADEMVQVRFVPSTSDAGKGGKKEWDAFYQQRLRSTIEIHFLAGYSKFMSIIFDN